MSGAIESVPATGTGPERSRPRTCCSAVRYAYYTARFSDYLDDSLSSLCTSCTVDRAAMWTSCVATVVEGCHDAVGVLEVGEPLP